MFERSREYEISALTIRFVLGRNNIEAGQIITLQILQGFQQQGYRDENRETIILLIFKTAMRPLLPRLTVSS